MNYTSTEQTAAAPGLPQDPADLRDRVPGDDPARFAAAPVHTDRDDDVREDVSKR